MLSGPDFRINGGGEEMQCVCVIKKLKVVKYEIVIKDNNSCNGKKKMM